MTQFEEDIVKSVTEDYERRREARRPLELQWRLNMNFVDGNQYCEILPGGEIADGGRQYWWQEREVYNHIASIVETRQSKLSRTKVGVTVMPFSSDDADTGAAKLSTALIKAVTEQNKMPQLINKAVGWSEVTGCCFFKTVWDPSLGEKLGEDADGREIRTGEARITVVPPFEIFPDDVCSALSDNRSLIHAKAYSVSEIKDVWGADVEGGEVDVFSLDGGAVGFGGSIGTVSSAVPDHCVVIERYTLPTSERPDGELAIVAGGKLLYYGALPFVTEESNGRGFPFSQMKCLEKVGSFFGTSVVERLIPLQRSYNAVKNRKHEFMNRIAMGVLTVEDGSVDTDNLEEEGLQPGKVLIYRQGANAPRFMDAGSVPADFRYEEERLLSEFITISGVSELSKYSQTYGSMSGTAISLLVEQDDARLAITSDSIRLCVKDVCAKIVRLYRQFSDGTRFKRLAGENGEPELTYFNSSDLQSDDLVFDCENELNDTLANRRNMVLELIRMGVLSNENGVIDVRSKVRILEMLGMGNWESGRDTDECQRKRAMRENLVLGKEEIKVCEYDDHELHVAEHVKALLEDRIYSDKRLFALMDEHIKQHKLAEIMISGAENSARTPQGDGSDGSDR